MSTLEARYNERLREITDRASEIPELERELQTLRKGLNACDKNEKPDTYYQTKDRITALQCEIKRRHEAEIEYMLDVAPFIKEYSRVAEPTEEKKAARGLDGFVQVNNVSKNQKVFQRYMMEVERDAAFGHHVIDTTDSHNEFVCAECASGMVIDARESRWVCEHCGYTRVYTGLTRDNMTYDQETTGISVVSTFAYQRSNHFAEWLARLQGKENTDIPKSVIDAVSAEFKKVKATQRSDITPRKVRDFLKKLRLQKYYEHTYIICHQLNGVPPPQLEPELEDELKRMFDKIQEPFRMLQQENLLQKRKNFLSYSYVLYKFCELLEKDHLLEFFPLLKSREKLYNQDQIFKRICTRLGWTFYRSC